MSGLLTEVELFMRATKMPPSRLGLLAAGDTKLVEQLKMGRQPRPELAAKVRGFIAANPQPYTYRAPSLWTKDRDEALWGMILAGQGHSTIAERMGVTIYAVRHRARELARIKQPGRRRWARATDAADGYGAAARPALLRRIDEYLAATGMAESRFGREAANDPRLVYDLRAGRFMSQRMVERVTAYIATGRARAPRPYLRGTWTPERENRLWSLIASGASRFAAAQDLGVSPVAIAVRLYRLADERLPDRPKGMRLDAAIRAASAQAFAPDISL